MNARLYWELSNQTCVVAWWWLLTCGIDTDWPQAVISNFLTVPIRSSSFFFYVAGINIYETRIDWHGNPAFNHRLRTNFMTIPLVQRFLSNVTTHFFLEHRELRKAGRKPSTVVHPRSQLDNGLQEQLELVVNHLLTWDVLPSRERHIQTALFGPLFFCFPDDSGCKTLPSLYSLFPILSNPVFCHISLEARSHSWNPFINPC